MISTMATVTAVAPVVFATVVEDLVDVTGCYGLLRSDELAMDDNITGLRVGAPSMSSGDGDHEVLEIVIFILDEIWQGLQQHTISVSITISIFNEI
ncbi:hypothetical protein TIFTF001_026358 [Ficus carica]|uniref:Secreted protein n=1 Tax=Ficus carica TaxID=3494 RepID=A0AA88IXY8_FICCA|nr:hypothetical protein TIFTF001_026358 [Ficus carica]